MSVKFEGGLHSGSRLVYVPSDPKGSIALLGRSIHRPCPGLPVLVTHPLVGSVRVSDVTIDSLCLKYIRQRKINIFIMYVLAVSSAVIENT